MPGSTTPEARVAVLTLKAIGYTWAQIAEVTGVVPRTAQGIYSRASKRGFDITKRPLDIRAVHINITPSGQKKERPETSNKTHLGEK